MTKTPATETLCPATVTLDLIANKWAVKILYTLSQANGQTLRFGQIQKSLHTITQRELTKHLREFEKAGLLTRIAYAEVPPRVEYTLTKLGMSLRAPVDTLTAWAEKYGAEVQNNRDEFEGRQSSINQ